MGRALKNHLNKEMMMSVEVLVLRGEFLQAIEATIDFTFCEEKLISYYHEDNNRLSLHSIPL
ncbi:hypothetical protein ACMYUM_23430 [Priestia megaterium]|uniref:hypothetical protein n=1 Tax=Priestia megaterium TaxID=1404 RepID=UPI0039F07C5B